VSAFFGPALYARDRRISALQRWEEILGCRGFKTPEPDHDLTIVAFNFVIPYFIIACFSATLGSLPGNKHLLHENGIVSPYRNFLEMGYNRDKSILVLFIDLKTGRWFQCWYKLPMRN